MLLAPHCPDLQCLSLGEFMFRQGLRSTITLPASVPLATWPQLKRFRGWLRVAQLLVPGRPVENIRIEGGVDELDNWEKSSLVPLAHGSAVLRELSLEKIPWKDNCFEDIADVLPHLRSLQVTFSSTPNQVSFKNINTGSQSLTPSS